ncbi:MAG: M48 family metalloprotease [Bdellovibrionaceae bacterium]|nr:M48 family metalloprotease [Pseudobdellovibrionaceae bacterium]
MTNTPDTKPLDPHSPPPSFWGDMRVGARRAVERFWHERFDKQHSKEPRLPLPPGQTRHALYRGHAQSIEANLKPGFDSLRVWGLLFAISALALWLGVEFGGRFGLVLGFTATLVLNLWILFLSPKQLLEQYRLWWLEGRDAWGLLNETSRVAKRAKVPTPRLAIADSDDLFSFSIGISPSRSTIVISQALVESLSRDELYAIVAFETAKIACQWTASATAARGLASLFDRFTGRLIIFVSLGRERVFQLDEWVASHGDSREVWARTLWSLDAMIGTKPRRTNVADCALDTVSSLTAFHAPRYDRTLPSVRSRIQALIDRYPP